MKVLKNIFTVHHLSNDFERMHNNCTNVTFWKAQNYCFMNFEYYHIDSPICLVAQHFVSINYGVSHSIEDCAKFIVKWCINGALFLITHLWGAVGCVSIQLFVYLLE